MDRALTYLLGGPGLLPRGPREKENLAQVASLIFYVRRCAFLPLKHVLAQLHTHILRHSLHVGFDGILHPAAKVQELANLSEIKVYIAREKDELEDEVSAVVPDLFGQRQIRRLDERT